MWYAFPVVGISSTNLRRLMDAAGAADATATPHTDGEKFIYVYNPWGQLVEIKKIGGGSVTHAKYTYSAMGHRISEQLDTNDSSNSGFGDGVVDAYDPVFFIATDPVGGGRRLATYRGTDSDPKETFIHHDARIRGPVHQGGPILRDRNAVLAEKVWYWAAESAETDRYERHYYALDYRGYVAAIFANDGTLVEQVRYSGTGVPFNIPLGDVDGNGKVESTGVGNPDYDQIEYMWKTPAYHVRGDLDLDGDIDAADVAIATARDGLGTGRGISSDLASNSRLVSINGEFDSQVRMQGSSYDLVPVPPPLHEPDYGPQPDPGSIGDPNGNHPPSSSGCQVYAENPHSGSLSIQSAIGTATINGRGGVFSKLRTAVLSSVMNYDDHFEFTTTGLVDVTRRHRVVTSGTTPWYAPSLISIPRSRLEDEFLPLVDFEVDQTYWLFCLRGTPPTVHLAQGEGPATASRPFNSRTMRVNGSIAVTHRVDTTPDPRTGCLIVEPSVLIDIKFNRSSWEFATMAFGLPWTVRGDFNHVAGEPFIAHAKLTHRTFIWCCKCH